MKPIGVKIHRADGTVLNAELAHEGIQDGVDNWVIANIEYRPGDTVTAEVLPPLTSITFAVAGNGYG